MIEQNKKRVVFIVNCLNVGGAERIVVEISNNMDLMKYDITIISLSEPDPTNSIFTVVPLKKEITLLYHPYDFDTDYSLLGYFKLIFRKASHPSMHPLIHFIESINPHIVHFHTTPRELRIGDHLKKEIKKVFTDHSIRFQSDEYSRLKIFLLAWMSKRLYKNYHVIAVSDAIQDNLSRLHILNTKKKILTLPNVIDTEIYRNTSGQKPEMLSVIYIARIGEVKGHNDLIKAWSLLKNISNKRLMIVGPDCLNGRIQHLAKELSCDDTIEFTGPVSNSKEWILKANIAVFPSYKEGLPLALLEKMSMELPVIASDIKELAAIIHNGENGILYKSGDYRALADSILLLYNDKELREQLGKNARIYVKKYHHMTNLQKKMENFYNEI